MARRKEGDKKFLIIFRQGGGLLQFVGGDQAMRFKKAINPRELVTENIQYRSTIRA